MSIRAVTPHPGSQGITARTIVFAIASLCYAFPALLVEPLDLLLDFVIFRIPLLYRTSDFHF